MDFTPPTLLLVALCCEFLVAVNLLLPGYWYLLKGNDFGSMSHLLGVSPGVLNKLLFEAGILKIRQDSPRTTRIVGSVHYISTIGNMQNTNGSQSG